MTSSKESLRAPYQGVTQIVQYNWPFYVSAALSVGVSALALKYLPLPRWAKHLGFVGLASASFWTVASLYVSYLVYDASDLYTWKWLKEWFPEAPNRWVNIHVGLDESTPTLRELFPNTHGTVLDIYDPSIMTEPSIARARKLTPPKEQAVKATLSSFPLSTGSADAVFVIFAAHEIREAPQREQFFQEIRRVLRPNGRLVLLEHARDWINAIAFGPGVFHFLPKEEWSRLANKTGFRERAERTFTPFVSARFLEAC